MKFPDGGIGISGELTPPSRFTLEYISPPEELRPLVTVFYHYQCEDAVIRDIQPAAIGHLSLFPRGKGWMSLPDGGADPSHEVNLLAPFAEAAAFVVEGPFHAIGAALTPLGWAKLTGLDAGEHSNRLHDAADFLPAPLVEQARALCEAYRAGTASAEACVAALGGIIASHGKLPPARYVEVIAATGKWLSSGFLPELEDLYAVSSYSRRQTQRLVQQYFGLAPVALRRKYRALRAAAMLSAPELSPGQEALIGEAFYDQPHMIREIRKFVGRTPARLGNPDTPILNELIASKNLRELE